MAAKKKGKTTRRKKAAASWECPNPMGKPYTLWELIRLLADRGFAQFFLEKLRKAEGNDMEAIDCVNSYLEPTEQELQELGIPASQWGSMRRCTDSGLLVLVTAQQNVSRPSGTSKR
jgi:uncharacterized protein (DUF2384 family)